MPGFNRASAPPRVIVIDDGDFGAVCEILAEIVAVELVPSAEAALSILAVEPRDVAAIVISADLPDEECFEAAIMMREVLGGSPPILLIGRSLGDRSRALQGYDAGALDCIVEPIDPEVLLARMSALLDFRTSQSVATGDDPNNEVRELLLAARAELGLAGAQSAEGAPAESLRLVNQQLRRVSWIVERVRGSSGSA